MRNVRLLDVVKGLNEGFTSSQCLGVTELDEVVFKECDEEIALFLSVLLKRSSVTSMLCSTPVLSESVLFRF